jgi:hypothetical protein
MSGSFGPPLINTYQMISDLGKTFSGAIEKGNKQRTIASLGEAMGGNIDPATLASAALQTGDMQMALTATQLAQAQADRQWQRQYQQQSLDLQRENAAENRDYRNRSLDIAERSSRNSGIPDGFMRTPEGGLAPIPGGPKDPAYIAQARARGDGLPPLTATDRKAILEADEGVLAANSAIEALTKAKELSPKAYGGVGAGARSAIGTVLPDAMVPDVLASPEQSTATQELDNLVGTNALSQLKAIFGGNPTEGERAIMMELQGASSKPDAVRQRIYDRAINMAKSRLAFNQKRAEEMRGGTFYRPEGGAAPQAQPAPSQYQEGKRYRSASTGKTYVIRNGVPVEE